MRSCLPPAPHLQTAQAQPGDLKPSFDPSSASFAACLGSLLDPGSAASKQSMSGHLQLLRQGLVLCVQRGNQPGSSGLRDPRRSYQPLWETQIGREKEGKEGSGEEERTGPRSVPWAGYKKRMQKTDEKDERDRENGDGGNTLGVKPSLLSSVQRGEKK